jgi:hypothetical protein
VVTSIVIRHAPVLEPACNHDSRIFRIPKKREEENFEIGAITPVHAILFIILLHCESASYK